MGDEGAPPPTDARVLADRRLHTTLECLLAIEATEVSAAMTEAAQLVADALGADKVDAMLHEPAGDCLVAVGTSPTPMGRRQHELGLNRLHVANDGREADVFRTGTPYITGCADEDPGQVPGIVHELGVRSSLIVPLDVAGERRGVLLASSARENRFAEDDLRFLGAVSRWVGVIAHRAELVERIAADAAERGRQMAADELVTVLAHDLGNQLAPLQTRIDLLRRRAQREGRELDLRDAGEAARSLLRFRRLIADLLDVGRIEQGLFGIEPRPFDLAVLVRETADTLGLGRGAIEVRTPARLEVRADPDRIRQALENLLTNAVKHSPAGTPVLLTVDEAERAGARCAVVGVADQGPGIPPALVPRLFDRFARGPGSSGLGLGLYLAHQIAAAHGGSLTVDPNRSAGARFVLELPAAGSAVAEPNSTDDRGGDA